MELIFDEDEVTEEQKKEILRLSKAEKGISREYLIRSGANLKNLHYAMQGMFGWQNRSAVPSSIMRKFVYKSGRTPSAQGRETCP